MIINLGRHSAGSADSSLSASRCFVARNLRAKNERRRIKARGELSAGQSTLGVVWKGIEPGTLIKVPKGPGKGNRNRDSHTLHKNFNHFVKRDKGKNHKFSFSFHIYSELGILKITGLRRGSNQGLSRICKDRITSLS
jgi:hypothetical protein